MRGYFFGNMYFAGIHAGIQSAHVVGEMFTKYDYGLSAYYKDGRRRREHDFLFEWVKDHKTMIVLNGGYSEELRSLICFFDTPDNLLPWAYFNESKEAADGCLTCVGIIIPENIYEYSKEIRETKPEEISSSTRGLSTWEIDLAKRLNKYPLAR